MSRWPFVLSLDSSADSPLYLQIAEAIVNDIRRGRLTPGAGLPGTRTLAATLHVHRKTVIAAYDELQAEGWIDSITGRGAFVARELPEQSFARASGTRTGRGRPAHAGFDLGEGPELPPPERPAPNTFLLSAGHPDLRRVPMASLSRAYGRALRLQGRSVLGYTMHKAGHPRLRTALARMLAATRAMAIDESQVLVTRGAQMALSLVARALCRPGDVIAVEALGYRPAWEAIRLTGARLEPIPVDRGGLQVEALADLVGRARVRAVYVTPHHQYPTTVTLTQERRRQLLALASRERMAIVEDDYDHEFHYDGRPILPIAASDTAGVVIYIGTLSKVLAPGLRLGFAVASAAVIDRLSVLRTIEDSQGDQITEAAVAELIEDGEVQRHVNRMRRVYRIRRDMFADALRARLGPTVRFDVPSGGMAIWTRVARGVDVDVWRERAAARGVQFSSGRMYTFDGRPVPFARLEFARLDDKDVKEVVGHLLAALPHRQVLR